MILLLVLILWTGMYALAVYVSWKKIIAHIKVYLLILYNAVYLTGVFLLFNFLAR
jgi:hypothetical protein